MLHQGPRQGALWLHHQAGRPCHLWNGCREESESGRLHYHQELQGIHSYHTNYSMLEVNDISHVTPSCLRGTI